jgi:hypothetical protein
VAELTRRTDLFSRCLCGCGVRLREGCTSVGMTGIISRLSIHGWKGLDFLPVRLTTREFLVMMLMFQASLIHHGPVCLLSGEVLDID